MTVVLVSEGGGGAIFLSVMALRAAFIEQRLYQALEAERLGAVGAGDTRGRFAQRGGDARLGVGERRLLLFVATDAGWRWSGVRAGATKYALPSSSTGAEPRYARALPETSCPIAGTLPVCDGNFGNN